MTVSCAYGPELLGVPGFADTNAKPQTLPSLAPFATSPYFIPLVTEIFGKAYHCIVQEQHLRLEAHPPPQVLSSGGGVMWQTVRNEGFQFGMPIITVAGF